MCKYERNMYVTLSCFIKMINKKISQSNPFIPCQPIDEVR